MSHNSLKDLVNRSIKLEKNQKRVLDEFTTKYSAKIERWLRNKYPQAEEWCFDKFTINHIYNDFISVNTPAAAQFIQGIPLKDLEE